MQNGRSFACSFTFLVGLMAVLNIVASAQKNDFPKPCEHASLEISADVQGYVFRAYRGKDFDTPGCVRIYHGGKLVYRLAADEAMTYTLGQPGNPEYKIPPVPNGTDLTGDGRPDMMVKSWSGGAHCCTTVYLFELRPKLRLIYTRSDGDADLGHFEDLDHNGRYFYVTNEIWSYWPASFAGSVSHKVILKWDKNKFKLDLLQMAYRAPTPEQWKEALQDVDDAADDRPSLGETLWDTVLDLVYTGHSDLAWKFVKEVNPKALRGNNPSLADFCQMLKGSEFWPDIEPTLKHVPDECTKATEKAEK